MTDRRQFEHGTVLSKRRIENRCAPCCGIEPPGHLRFCESWSKFSTFVLWGQEGGAENLAVREIFKVGAGGELHLAHEERRERASCFCTGIDGKQLDLTIVINKMAQPGNSLLRLTFGKGRPSNHSLFLPPSTAPINLSVNFCASVKPLMPVMLRRSYGRSRRKVVTCSPLSISQI